MVRQVFEVRSLRDRMNAHRRGERCHSRFTPSCYRAASGLNQAVQVAPFPVRSRSEDSELFGPGWDRGRPVPSSEFPGRHMTQGRVRPALVVIPSPSLDFGPSILHAHGPVHMQAFFAGPSVEGFDGGVVRRLAGLDEVQRHPLLIRRTVRRYPILAAVRCAWSWLEFVVAKGLSYRGGFGNLHSIFKKMRKFCTVSAKLLRYPRAHHADIRSRP